MSYNFFVFRLKNVLGNRLKIVLTSNIEITDTRPAHITRSLPPTLSPTHTHMPNAMTPANTNNVINAFLSSAGQFASVTFKSNPKPAAEFKGVTLEKTTTGVFRSGVNFANLASTKAEFATGERTEVQPLAWGSWEQFPFVIAHKGERFLRLTTVNGVKSKSTFKVNGTEVSRDEFEKFLVPSARSSAKAPTEVFNIKEANLVSFNGEVSEAEVANG
jgi:hypothetical protein